MMSFSPGGLISMFWNNEQKRSAQLRLETLENRWCPSVTSGITEGTLTVTGDARANGVRIVANGDQVTVTTGGRSQTFTGIDTVTADLRGGSDRLNMSFSGNASQTLNVNVMAGTGNDRVFIDLNQLNASASVNLNVDLGAGHDSFRLMNDGLSANASLALSLNARSGNDRVALALGTISDGGSATVNVEMGTGNDVLSGRFGEVNENANLSVTANGAAGRDNAYIYADTSLFDNVTLNGFEHVFWRIVR